VSLEPSQGLDGCRWAGRLRQQPDFRRNGRAAILAPIDGHNLPFGDQHASSSPRPAIHPIVIHVLTRKGKRALRAALNTTGEISRAGAYDVARRGANPLPAKPGNAPPIGRTVFRGRTMVENSARKDNNSRRHHRGHAQRHESGRFSRSDAPIGTMMSGIAEGKEHAGAIRFAEWPRMGFFTSTPSARSTPPSSRRGL